MIVGIRALVGPVRFIIWLEIQLPSWNGTIHNRPERLKHMNVTAWWWVGRSRWWVIFGWRWHRFDDFAVFFSWQAASASDSGDRGGPRTWHTDESDPTIGHLDIVACTWTIIRRLARLHLVKVLTSSWALTVRAAHPRPLPRPPQQGMHWTRTALKS